MDFKQQLEAIKQQVNDFITSDMPTDQIDQLGKIKDQLDSLGEAHQQTLDEFGQLKDRYIDAVKNYGTGKEPNTSDVGTGQEKTLEDLAQELFNK